MLALLKRFSFALEFFYNGGFIALYSIVNFSLVDWTLLAANTNYGPLLQRMGKGVPLVLMLVVVMNFIRMPDIAQFFRRYIFSLLILAATLISWGDLEFCFWFTSVHILSSILTLFEEDIRKIRIERTTLTSLFKLPPAQIVLMSFALWIAIGTVLFMLPISAAPNVTISFVDALFMATSASCVTGLATMSIGNSLSLFGQMVLLVLVQIGGLGIMILYGSMAILAGKYMPLKERVVMQDLLDASNMDEIIVMIVDIVRYTILIELWGAIILTVGFTLEGFEFGRSLYLGFFHSIMAFCNAGFGLFDNSLEDFATVPLVHGTIAILIILGGVGFVVLKDLRDNLVLGFNPTRFRMHTKVVLSTTGILLLAGTLLVFFGEFLSALDNYTLWEKLQISFFQSVTLRTAGFDSIAIGSLQQHTIYVMGIFMFIGGSSGSTAGGIKVTTFAILYQSMKSILYNRPRVEAFDRTIPAYVVVKSTALVFISMAVVAVAIFVMIKIEPSKAVLSLYFEVLSAFGTVGLSTGITSDLSYAGKLVIAFIMYIGRIGPLTLILAVGQHAESNQLVEYPEGRVLIG
ncbi:MAG: Trk family potassium uptake protein [Oligoflexia bacterium]|nr:Trk family potassium uptake protein [Oligoflexia bacterium]